MGGKTSTSTSTVQVPPDVLARYNSVNSTAEKAASTPFQQYSTDPSAFVAPLTGTQQAGIQNTNTAAGQAQPYYGAATGELLNAQSSAQPYYTGATYAANQGVQGGNYLLNASNNAVNTGLQSSLPTTGAAEGLATQGTEKVDPQQIGAAQINQFMNPYLGDVVNSTSALLNQNNQQAMAGQLGNAIQSGAFGGDRAGIAAANLNQQQNLANANIYSGLLNTGYNTALGAAQQQQGVNLGAQQANRAALQQGATSLANIGQQKFSQGLGEAQQFASNANSAYNMDSGYAGQLANLGQGQYNIGANTANTLAGLGAGAQSAALQGATAQLSAGQQEQSTEQAGKTALYNQFLQQQAYPFQTSQFLANIAEGTGSLSGSTTSTTQPTGLFGNLLSDRRAKYDIKKVGHNDKNGLPIYIFKYKGDPDQVTHIGYMADEVEKKHPEAVGLAGGLKTVDYERASRADGGGLVFDPNAGEYGLGAASMPGRGTYVPAPSQSAARHIAFQHSPPAPRSAGLSDLAGDYKTVKGLYNDGSSLWNDGKSVVSGLGAAAGYSNGGLALKRDDGGYIDDPYQSDAALMHRQHGLAAGEAAMEQAPNSSANGPVSSALASQATSPKYSLGAAPQVKSNAGSGGLGQLASLATLGSDIAPYALALFGLKDGGLVPREHHADGDIVGDDPNSPENAEIRKEYPSANYGDAPAAPAGLKPGSEVVSGDIPAPHPRPKGLGASPDPQEDIPTPPARPSDLNAPAPAAEPAPGLAPRQPHYRYLPPAVRTMNADNGGQDASSFIKSLESGGKFNAVNPASSAYGLGQFTADTAKTVSARHPELAPLEDFYSQDPKVAVPAQNAYVDAHVRDQAKVLTANGIEPTPQNIHMNWFLGEAGGPAFLKAMYANPDAPGASLARPEQVAANKGVFFNGDGTPKTAAQVYASINGGSGLAAGLGAASPMQPHGGLASGQPQQPGLMDSLSRFFHGQPDGQTSPNGGMGERALMAVLSGLGAVGSYKGQSPLGAILQGLGAGAHGWMDSGKQQADIANTQAGTLGTNVGTVQSALKGPFVIDQYGRPILKGDYMDNPGPVAGSRAVASGIPLPTAPHYTPPPGLVPPVPSVTPPAPTKAPSPLAAEPDSTASLPAEPAALGDVGKQSIARDFQQARSVAGDESTMGDFMKRNKDAEAEISDRYNAAHTTGAALNQIGKELSDLSQDGSTLKPGPLQAWKQTLASQWNAIIGDSPTAQQYKVSPEDIGTAEAAHKMTLGMSFARASSNHQNTIEALSAANAATPNASITPAGIRKIMASMYADKQRDIDAYNYLQQYKDYARSAGGTGKANWYVPQNALAAFNKEHNDTEYANLRTAIEQAWKDSYTSKKTGETQSRASGAIQGRIGSKAIDGLYNVPGLHRVFENN